MSGTDDLDVEEIGTQSTGNNAVVQSSTITGSNYVCINASGAVKNAANSNDGCKN